MARWGTASATPAARARGGTAGFSFVEVLVTTIVLGLLAALAIPSFMSTRDQATGATAQSLLRTAATAVETAAVEPEGYATLTPAGLAATEPAIGWLAAPGAEATADQVSITGISPMGYTLTTTAASGTVHVLVKDLTATPTVRRTCGPGCSW